MARTNALKRRYGIGLAQMAGLLVALFVVLVIIGWLASWLTTALQVPTLREISRFALGLVVAEPSDKAVRATSAVLAWAVIILGFVLPMVTYQIYALRKVLGFMQARVGPTQVGPQGLLQTPADVIKLLSKEDIIPLSADRIVFSIAPFMVLVPSFMAYLVVPFGNRKVVDGEVVYSLVASDLSIGVLYLSAITSIAVIGVMAAGWSSNNKYSLIGAMRSAAQLITYEIPLTVAFMTPVIWYGTLNLNEMVEAQNHLGAWFVWPWYGFLAPVLFWVSALAELSHPPFDLPEAESELVTGFNVEYSGMKFAMFFLAEFANAFTLSAIFVTLFLGGWQSPFPASWPLLGWDTGLFALVWFFAKSFAFVFLLFWIRATVPRLRIDQLMGLGWKVLIPVALLNMIVVALLKMLIG